MVREDQRLHYGCDPELFLIRPYPIQPLVLTYHSGQYLPDWASPGRLPNLHVAKRTTGAGREIVPFELSWLTWLLGKVANRFRLKTRVTDL